MTHNALQTLWGSGDTEKDIREREDKRKNTAKSMISPSINGSRPQEIYTPQNVLNVVKEIWPEGIMLDPCTGINSIIETIFKYDGITLDGLKEPWMERTYINPPFKHLKLWLEKARNEADKINEIIVLCPVRTHRNWWRKTMECADAVCWMDPLKFNGYKQAFPAPLCLFYWGNRVNEFNIAKKSLSKD